MPTRHFHGRLINQPSRDAAFWLAQNAGPMKAA
jgi:hypothetical protein